MESESVRRRRCVQCDLRPEMEDRERRSRAAAGCGVGPGRRAPSRSGRGGSGLSSGGPSPLRSGGTQAMLSRQRQPPEGRRTAQAVEFRDALSWAGVGGKETSRPPLTREPIVFNTAPFLLSRGLCLAERDNRSGHREERLSKEWPSRDTQTHFAIWDCLAAAPEWSTPAGQRRVRSSATSNDLSPDAVKARLVAQGQAHCRGGPSSFLSSSPASTQSAVRRRLRPPLPQLLAQLRGGSCPSCGPSPSPFGVTQVKNAGYRQRETPRMRRRADARPISSPQRAGER